MFLQILLFLQLSRLTLTSSSTPLPLTKPGCQAKCGNFTIPYPFGIGPSENGCSFYGEGQFYNITCDASFNPPKPLLWFGTNGTTGKHNMIELISISETESEVRVKSLPATLCYDKTGKATIDDSPWMGLIFTPFTVSSTKNKFFGLGCDTIAHTFDPLSGFNATCFTSCKTKEDIMDGSCAGKGCCQIELPSGLKRIFSVVGSSPTPKPEILSFDPCSYSFVSEIGKYNFSSSDLNGTNFLTEGRDIPIVLNWAIGNKTCEEAQKDSSTFLCQTNSKCSNSNDGPGYICACDTGFAGNPYLSPGCQDINECEDQENNPCEGICINTIGGYICQCQEGTYGDGRKGGIGCITRKAEFPIVKVTL
ncbi:hypothetical protein MKW94_027455, partial [Papaver nudicaule]|nr:hypothetical protein [Papaver nudicaule]